MILTNEQLKEIYFGALYFSETEDGYLQSYQYTKPQMDYFESFSEFYYDRCYASTAKTVEITTTATEISFDYKILWIGSADSFEASVNGLATQVYYVKDLKNEGKLTFQFEEGEKKVVIYLPADATAVIKNFSINGEYTKAKKNEKVLWLGDSITQGFGPLRSSHTYVSVANRELNYDILNQGIGGYVYDKKCMRKMEDYMPDKIIVAMGTNQYHTETMTDIEEYYETLMEIYGKTPILCVTPIWRGDGLEDLPILISFSEKLKNICKKYDNVKVVDGFTLVPHMSEYYLDNLHPNLLGAEMYGRNLVKAIRELDF